MSSECNKEFHELGVALLAKRMLVDYRMVVTVDPTTEPEAYAENWIKIFVCGPEDFKNEILSAFSELLVKGRCDGQLHSNI